ncbi:hypothetical protein HBA54_16470 [Pelagibius litoralis]|uniref:DUF6969 domain-containing protein n=1 Tax=Pelagibius litoralis TaxID=374515 RepID=A0A967EZ94_9PROT|nr:hypothetical protein [Pelagibius litoralis]NIA70203.1 hypothetical protein [Pelagibius litoralis]
MRSEAQIRESALDSDFDLKRLSSEELQAMAEAGREVAEVHRVLAKTSDNIVGELLKNNGTFYEWDHYPPGDVYDHETHGQYYYHAHAIDQRFEGEHGHFHTFVRPKGMPPGIKPAPVAGFMKPKDPNDALSHLIAISMTPGGLPFRIFTVNRWVTGEVWYSAKDVAVLLEYFKIDHTQPSWPVNRWVTAMVQLYRPQIIDLLEARDRKVALWQQQNPDGDVFEDRDLEVTSYLDVDPNVQIQSVAKILLSRQ